jgi:hypothetical protein
LHPARADDALVAAVVEMGPATRKGGGEKIARWEGVEAGDAILAVRLLHYPERRKRRGAG